MSISVARIMTVALDLLALSSLKKEDFQLELKSRDSFSFSHLHLHSRRV